MPSVPLTLCAAQQPVYSPYYLMHGHHQRLPFEAEAEQNYDKLAEVIECLNSEAELARRIEMLGNLSCVYNKVIVNIEKAQEKQKQQYAKKGFHCVCVRKWRVCP